MKQTAARAHRYRIDLSYEGTAYAGWQIQPGNATVQEKIEDAIRILTGASVRVHGSGRTDRGVHARRQVAHFDLPRVFPARNLRTGLNAVLPPDIRVLRAVPAPASFHARKSAKEKEYRYFIRNGDVVAPFERRTVHQVRNRLDVAAMRDAASRLEGRHDFSAFSANPNREIVSPVRRLRALQVRRSGALVAIRARGDGFLYKMVRSLVGFLIRVGEGALPPEAATAILASRKRTARVPSAPARGLMLWQVWY